MEFEAVKDDDWERKVEVDLSRVCRLCLKACEALFPIFDSRDSQAALAHRIMACAQIKVFEGDGLPTHVCSTCFNQVERSYQFKLLCERSDSKLRGNLQSVNGGSDTESLDGGEGFDMTKLTPEVIIKVEAEEPPPPQLYIKEKPSHPHKSHPPIQVSERNGEVYHSVEALLRKHSREPPRSEPYMNGMASMVQSQEVARAAIALALSQRSQQVVVSAGPSPRSRRCRGGEKAFKCRQCNKSYSFSSALSRHKAVHNTALRPHVCHICKKGFTQAVKLIRHQKTHTMDSIMTCDLCTVTFKSFAAYQKHKQEGGCVQVMIDEPPTDIPLSLVLKPEDLKGEPLVARPPPPALVPRPPPVVEARVSSPPPPYKETKPSGKGKPEFTCPVCFKCFATRGSLDVHSSIHTGVRPFVCSICQQAFRHKVNLMEHFQRKHSQVRPYQCDVCAARFVTKQELVRHYKKHIGD